MFWFDRALRSVLGVLMLLMGYYGSQSILYATGGFLLATGISGFCPFYALSGESYAEPKTSRKNSEMGASSALTHREV